MEKASKESITNCTIDLFEHCFDRKRRAIVTRLFLSFQMRYIVTWTARRFRILETAWVCLKIQLIRSCQSTKRRFGKLNRERTSRHTWSEKPHWRKRWSLDSGCELQKQQVTETLISQAISLTLVGNLSRFVVQKVKACLETAYLGQTAFVQGTTCAVGLSKSHVFFVEKLLPLEPSTTLRVTIMWSYRMRRSSR